MMVNESAAKFSGTTARVRMAGVSPVDKDRADRSGDNRKLPVASPPVRYDTAGASILKQDESGEASAANPESAP